MSFRDSWMHVGKVAEAASPDLGNSYFPPPLHLILIEEPEAHLHAQVQQVFIRKAYKVLRAHGNLGPNPKLRTQLVVSTHSSHIAHECEFLCLRYFRRLPPSGAGEVPISTVTNLSEVFGLNNETERFVTRYLKATHCDLFFADAAILVEGPAERILVPPVYSGGFSGIASGLCDAIGDRRKPRTPLAPLDRETGIDHTCNHRSGRRRVSRRCRRATREGQGTGHA